MYKEDRKVLDNTVRRMTDDDVKNMMRHLVRLPRVYMTYHSEITKQCFNIPETVSDYNYGELAIFYVWRGLAMYYEEQQASDAPTLEMLCHYIKEIIRTGVYIDQPLVTTIFDSDPSVGLVAYMYAVSDGGLNEITASPLVKDFLRERIVSRQVDMLRTFGSSDINRTIAGNLRELSDAASRIDSLGIKYTPPQAIPEQSWFESLPEAPEMNRTGVEFVDRALGGGQTPGDCNSIIGATGAGKTTLAVQMSVGIAKNAFTTAMEKNRKPDLVFYCSYEQSSTGIWERFISVGADIARTSVSLCNRSSQGLMNPSTDPLHPKEYESLIWPSAEDRYSEVDRFRRFMTWVNPTLRICNMSGVPDLWEPAGSPEAKLTESRGSGGIDELYTMISQICDEQQANPRAIFIDYAGIMTKRMKGYSDPDKQLQLLQSFGDQCRCKLAGRLNCTVWVLQQLVGRANAGSVQRKASTADAAGCANFNDNMANAFVLNATDRAAKSDGGACAMFECVKSRNAVSSHRVIVQHNKYIAKLDDVTSHYRVNPRGMIVRRDS